MKLVAEIDALAYGGSCIGRVTNQDLPEQGKKVFVRGAIPGEKVELEVTEENKSYDQAILLKVLNPSTARIDPPCDYYGECGGCDSQHIEDVAQRQFKRDMVENTLKIQGKLVAQDGVHLIGADLPSYNYRARIALHLDTEGNLGFYKIRSTDLVPISRCLIASDLINGCIQTIQPLLPALAPYVEAVWLEEHEAAVVPVLKLREGNDLNKELRNQLKEHFATVKIESISKTKSKEKDSLSEIDHVGHFAQVNPAGNQILVQTICTLLTDAKNITELYAGSGNFSLPLAQQGALVDAVEVEKALVRHGRELVEKAGFIGRVKFFESSAEKYVKNNPVRNDLLLDPPRAGAKEIMKLIKPADTKRIVYVSCNLPSLTRDLRTLCENGYNLQQVQVLDMFPQTHHVECIALLSAAQ